MTKPELEAEVTRLTAELEKANAAVLELQEQLAAKPVPTTPAPTQTLTARGICLAASLPDNPADPRPAFDPELGWRTPAVEQWAQRQLQRN